MLCWCFRFPGAGRSPGTLLDRLPDEAAVGEQGSRGEAGSAICQVWPGADCPVQQTGATCQNSLTPHCLCWMSSRGMMSFLHRTVCWTLKLVLVVLSLCCGATGRRLKARGWWRCFINIIISDEMCQINNSDFYSKPLKSQLFFSYWINLWGWEHDPIQGALNGIIYWSPWRTGSASHLRTRGQEEPDPAEVLTVSGRNLSTQEGGSTRSVWCAIYIWRI